MDSTSEVKEESNENPTENPAENLTENPTEDPPGSPNSSSSPLGDKDFIYVEETKSNTSKKSSNGSSYADINSIDFEPTMGKNEHGHDISELVLDAQMEDFHPNYYDNDSDHGRSQSDVGGQTDSSSNDDEDNASIKRCPSDSHAKDACVLFHGVTYLGSATVNAPVSELELRRTVSILRDNTEISIDVILGITLQPSGDVRLIDPESRTDIASYNISNILFWGKGDHENREKDCFAFNVSHGKEDVSFQCHVFKCQEEDQAMKILQSLAQTIKKDKKRRQNDFPLRRGSTLDPNNLTFKFNVTVEIWEEDGKGSFQTVARDKNHFKLRQQLHRKIVLYVEQISNMKLKVERCFGLLIAAGRDVPGEEMHLLQHVEMEPRPGNRFVISGHWDPSLEPYKLLNTDTGKDNKIFMSIAADIVFHDVKEPVRFVKEVKVRVFGTNEKFWNPTKPRISEEYTLQLKENFTDLGEKYYEKESLNSATDVLKAKTIQQTANSNNSLSSLWRSNKSQLNRHESTTSEIEEILYNRL